MKFPGVEPKSGRPGLLWAEAQGRREFPQANWTVRSLIAPNRWKDDKVTPGSSNHRSDDPVAAHPGMNIHTLNVHWYLKYLKGGSRRLPGWSSWEQVPGSSKGVPARTGEGLNGVSAHRASWTMHRGLPMYPSNSCSSAQPG